MAGTVIKESGKKPDDAVVIKDGDDAGDADDVAKIISHLPTLSEAEIARTLEMSPESIADLAETIAHNPNSTIEPSRMRSDALGKQALAGLGEERATGGIAGGLTFGATIGEGGMGVVRTALQRSLNRKVAVKTLRPQIKTEQATLRLLREAWVTGSLEHPNIVPVYDLGLDDDGTPIIVLKHIEGKPWCDLIAGVSARENEPHSESADLVKEKFGADDLLEHNLRVLVSVCNAVSLAHARGVIHRDLKPENVMVGSFGEVYLVDWGIAVSLKDDMTGRLPLASQATEMAGTPSYMAPEMLGAMGKLSERTDIYLLGAILYEILTGHPPHVGDNFRQVVASILLSHFKFAPEIPPELAAIASKAMSRAADDRFASADELEKRLEWYLRHRGSLALSAEASLRVDEMSVVLASTDIEVDEVRDRVHHLFAEARFGFRQAIRACDDNDVAKKGLHDATSRVVVFELEKGTPEAASAALAELDTPPPDLAKRVAVAMKGREAEKRRVVELEKLSADLDPATGRRTRLAAAAMLGSMWTIFPIITGWIYRTQRIQYWWMYIFTISIVIIALVITRWGRESLGKTIINRRVQAAGGLMFAMQLTLQVAGSMLHMPFALIWVLHLYCWLFSICTLAIFVDRRFWPSTAVFVVMFFVACVRPDLIWFEMSIANFSLLINFIIAWSRPDEDRGFFVARMRERIEAKKRRYGSWHHRKQQENSTKPGKS